MTIGSLMCPLVIFMVITGSLVSLTGDSFHFFGNANLKEIILRVLLTSGFFILGFVMLKKRGDTAEFPHFLAAASSLGFVLTFALTVAVYKAAFRKDRPLFAKKTSWICTPKSGNEQFIRSV